MRVLPYPQLFEPLEVGTGVFPTVPQFVDTERAKSNRREQSHEGASPFLEVGTGESPINGGFTEVEVIRANRRVQPHEDAFTFPEQVTLVPFIHTAISQPVDKPKRLEQESLVVHYLTAIEESEWNVQVGIVVDAPARPQPELDTLVDTSEQQFSAWRPVLAQMPVAAEAEQLKDALFVDEAEEQFSAWRPLLAQEPTPSDSIDQTVTLHVHEEQEFDQSWLVEPQIPIHRSESPQPEATITIHQQIAVVEDRSWVFNDVPHFFLKRVSGEAYKAIQIVVISPVPPCPGGVYQDLGERLNFRDLGERLNYQDDGERLHYRPPNK